MFSILAEIMFFPASLNAFKCGCQKLNLEQNIMQKKHMNYLSYSLPMSYYHSLGLWNQLCQQHIWGGGNNIVLHSSVVKWIVRMMFKYHIVCVKFNY